MDENFDRGKGGAFRASSPSELEKKDEDPREPRENSGGGWIDRKDISSGIDMSPKSGLLKRSVFPLHRSIFLTYFPYLLHLCVIVAPKS